MWLIAIVVPGTIIENLTMLAVLDETTLAVRRFLKRRTAGHFDILI